MWNWSLGSQPLEVANSYTEEFDHVLEGVIEILLQGVPVAGFQMGKAMESAAEGSGRMHPRVLGQIERYERLTQRVHNAIDGGL